MGHQLKFLFTMFAPHQGIMSRLSKDSGHGTDTFYSDETLLNAILATNIEIDQVTIFKPCLLSDESGASQTKLLVTINENQVNLFN